jgi:hypothetical protein
LKAVHEKYGDQIRVVAVNVYEGDRAVIEEFVKEFALPYTILLHGDKLFRATYRGRSIPQTYLINTDGKIADAHGGWSGDGDRKRLEARIDKLLAD